MRTTLVGPNLIWLDYYSWASSWSTSKKAQITVQATDTNMIHIHLRAASRAGYGSALARPYTIGVGGSLTLLVSDADPPPLCLETTSSLRSALEVRCA